MHKLFYYDKDIYEKDRIGQQEFKIYSKGNFQGFIAEWQDKVLITNDPNDKIYNSYCIKITDTLCNELICGDYKLKENIILENRIYTLDDIALFEKIITIPNDPPDSQPTITDRLAFLESEHITNVSSILDLDFRVTDIEFTIESPMIMNLNNIKGEIKTMARTPYEMMKILIIAGEYDETDMTYKINRYHEMKKITIEQKEELLGLIEANKVVE